MLDLVRPSVHLYYCGAILKFPAETFSLVQSDNQTPFAFVSFFDKKGSSGGQGRDQTNSHGTFPPFENLDGSHARNRHATMEESIQNAFGLDY